MLINCFLVITNIDYNNNKINSTSVLFAIDWTSVKQTIAIYYTSISVCQEKRGDATIDFVKKKKKFRKLLLNKKASVKLTPLNNSVY